MTKLTSVTVSVSNIRPYDLAERIHVIERHHRRACVRRPVQRHGSRYGKPCSARAMATSRSVRPARHAHCAAPTITSNGAEDNSTTRSARWDSVGITTLLADPIPAQLPTQPFNFGPPRPRRNHHDYCVKPMHPFLSSQPVAHRT
jgi:hypothetical protein